MNHPKLYLTLFLSFALTIVYAQPYYFRHYEVESGLSNNTVFCSTQDRDGFMWFGTKDGLNRFDGYRFKLFNIDKPDRNNISRDLVGSVAIDNMGRLWVGANKGLYLFDMLQERLLPVVDTMLDIHNINADKNGRLWFISDHTVCIYEIKEKKLTTFPPSEYLIATTICTAADGTIWFGTMDGYLARYVDAEKKFIKYDLFNHSPVPVARFIQTIYADDKGSVFVGTTGQGIKQFNVTTGQYTDILTYNAEGTIIYVRDVLENNDNELWFGTESGIYILDRKTGKFQNLRKKFLDPYSISDNAVYTLTKDMEGGIWAGTYFGGLNYYPKQYFTFKKFFPDHSNATISGSAVREIVEDGFGNLWVGTEDAGISKIDERTGEIKHFLPTGGPGSIANSNIHGLLAVGNDLWIGTFERGLDVMDIRSGKVKKHFRSGTGPHDLKSDFIVQLLRSKEGTIFLGTSMGVFTYNAAEDNFDAITEMPTRFISCLYEDSKGFIWTGTHGDGAWRFDPATRTAIHYVKEKGNNNSLSASFVNAIHEDKNGDIWFATDGGGLSKLNKINNQFSRYSTYEGLPSNFAFKVLEDDRHRLWITTSKGLVSMNLSGGEMTVYTKANGLLNDQFNYNSGYKDANGTLYFGSVRGMITFNPESFGESEFIPKVYLTGFQVNNKETEIGPQNALKSSILHTETITLPYNESTFSFDFAALSFTSPERTDYSYKMEGVDRDWTQIKSNRRVYFTNLGAGTYMFKLRAAGPGFAGVHEKKLIVRVLPPFWATNFAYFVYILVSLSLMYYLFKSYHKVQEGKKEKEIYEAKIDFFTNIAHEIKTPLTLINGPVDNLRDLVNEMPLIKDDVKMLERNTKRLVDLVNQILDFRQVEAKGFSLDFSLVNLTELIKENYVSFETLAIKKKLNYHLELPSSPVYILADDEALNKIFSNLFSNAVKYGEREVNISLMEPVRDMVRVEISNDGRIIPADMREKIFEPFVRLKESTKQKGTGIGLALTRSLTGLHGGKVYFEEEKDGMNVFVLELPAGHVIKQNNTLKAIEKPIIS